MIVNVKSSTDLSGFYVVFGGSTMNEKPGWFGLSHLMEHMVCGVFDHLQDEYQIKNINWNAMTSNSNVVFYIKGLDRHINEHKQEFLDLLLSYEPTQKDLDKEKKIVLEEYKMMFNSQGSAHYFNLHRKMYGYYNAIGLRSDIEKFTLEDCKEYLDLYYKKPTRIINISKNNEFVSDVEFREDIEHKSFETIKDVKTHCITSDDETDVPDGLVPLETITDYNNKVSIMNLTKIMTTDFAYGSFICEMLCAGLNSPLYKEVREKLGLVYSISCFVDKLNNESAVITIMTDTSDKNIEIVQDEIKGILDNKEKYLTQERFDIIKESYITKLEESKILNHSNYRKHMDADKWRLEPIINDITLEDVHRVANEYLVWDNMYKSIDKKEFKQ